MSYVATNTDITSLAGKDYAPYMYHGDNNSNNAVAIRGYVTPIVGGFMCYSGAPSGAVCGNEITHTGVAASYGYNGLTRTVQYLGTPALGNGDSGGPAYAVTSQGYAYAIGVISGMSNAGSTCTGDPSSSRRQCSAIGLFRAGGVTLRHERVRLPADRPAALSRSGAGARGSVRVLRHRAQLVEERCRLRTGRQRLGELRSSIQPLVPRGARL